MCVVNKQFELLEFVFDSVYVDLQYDEVSLTFTTGYLCMCGICSHLWYVCEVVLLPYVDAVVAVTVMCVLLHVCMLRDFDDDGVCVVAIWVVHTVQVLWLPPSTCKR